MNRRHSAAFTLVELLVVICLMVLVTGAVTAVLSAGFRVWEKVQKQGEVNSKTQNTFLSLARDIHNVHPFRPIPFDGEYDLLSFPMLIDVKYLELRWKRK